MTVTGPKGTLQRTFKHMSLDLQKVNDGKQIKVDLWFGNRETIAAIRYKMCRIMKVTFSLHLILISFNDFFLVIELSALTLKI